MVKVVLAFLLTQPSPTAVVRMILPGMVMVVVMLHDARAAAEAPLEGTRNEAGKWDVYRPGSHTYPRGLVVALLPEARIPVTISTSLA